MSPQESDRDPCWAWEESRWRAGVEKIRAGRPLRPARWKGGARVCVALSFDPDHETSTLRDGSVSPGRLSQGEYGSRVAVPRILEVLDEGHEIGMHGWIHEWTGELLENVERDLMRRAYETLTKITGKTPVGVRVPSWDFSPSTLKLIRELGLLYDSSLMADDEPYELLEDGHPTGVVELPVEWIKDDAPYFGMNRASGLRPYTAPSAVLEALDTVPDVSGLARELATT
jgi:hypothetical protein